MKQRNRIFDALESNAFSNDLSALKINIKSLTTDEFNNKKDRLLFLSLKNASKDTALYLIEKGALLRNFLVLYECKFDIIDRVFNLISELPIPYNDVFPELSIITFNKSNLIERLIDPNKIDHPNGQARIEYLLYLVKSGFFDISDVKSTINKLYESKPKPKGLVLGIIREITLNELGI